MSKEKTEEEVRAQFLNHVRMLVDYWEKETSKETIKERLNGLAFSILVAIDGEAASLPAFILAPDPHKESKQFDINEGDDYFPENHNSTVKCNISGSLHDKFFK